MEATQQKEKAKGIWSVTGQEVSFTREWGGYRFTDDEVKKLLAGEEIEVPAKNVKGKLSEQEFKGHKFIGFEKTEFLNNNTNNGDYCTGNWNGKDIKFKKVWGGHTFTDTECKDLLAGKEIQIKGLKSSKGTTYGIKGKLTEQEYNGHKFVGFEKTGFADGVPNSWSKHVFTEEEKNSLEAGCSIKLEDCISSKTGKVFSCNVKYGKRDDGSMGIIPSFD